MTSTPRHWPARSPRPPTAPASASGNISSQLESVELIGADGTSRTIGTGDGDFDAARVSLGALGVIYAATVRMVPAFTVERADHPLPLARDARGRCWSVPRRSTTSSSSSSPTPTAPCCARAAAPTPHRSRRTPRCASPARSWSRTGVSGALMTIARLQPAAGPRLAQLAARTFAQRLQGRSQLPGLLDRPPHPLHRDGVLGSDRACPRGLRGLRWRSPSRPQMQCALPIEVRFRRRRSGDALAQPPDATAATSPSTRTRSSTGAPTSRRSGS